MRCITWNLILFIGLAVLSGCEQDQHLPSEMAEQSVEVDPASLPSSVQAYISANYPGQSIYEAERDDSCEVYEVELDNGVELYFDLQGNFLGTDYDCEDDGYDDEDDYLHPDSLPANVLSYISTNYPSDSISEVELDDECEEEVYVVELSSGVDLYFDLQGNFLGTDDTYDCEDDNNGTGYDDDDFPPDSLPANVLSYISTNYPSDSISEVELDDECEEEVYVVELSSGVDLYFDLQGNFLGTDDTYDCDDGTGYNDDDLHPNDLPANVLSYISTNYPSDSIYEVELDDECEEEVYVVELSSGVELYFDLQGNFLGTDDTYECDDDDD